MTESNSHDLDEQFIHSDNPDHPANLICTLQVTGTGGGTIIKHGEHIYIGPSGVQKELMKPTDMFVMDFKSKEYLQRPKVHKPSACTPLFLAAFRRGAGCCIHMHSQWAVLITLLVERDFGKDALFKIKELE